MTLGRPGHGPSWCAHCRVSRSGIGAGGISLTGKLKPIQRAMPPSSGRTRVTPRRLSRSASRALVASLGQEQ
jgi:hypothetical protein